MTESGLHESLFHIRDIRKTFRNGSCINYKGELFIRKGCFTFIIGDSGRGKSTLLNMLGLLDKAEGITNDSVFKFYPPNQNGEEDYPKREENYFTLFEGKWWQWCQNFRLSSKRAEIRRSYFGFLPQGGHLLNTFSIRENLELIMRFRHKPCQKQADTKEFDTSNEIKALLKRIGFKENEKIWDEKRNFSPMILSGGQKQRLAIARTLICDCHPKVIFVDEPTTYLNPELIDLCIQVLATMVKKKSSVILVTHDEKLEEKLTAYLPDNKNEESLIDTYEIDGGKDDNEVLITRVR